MHCRGLQKFKTADCRGQGREAEGRGPYSLTFIHVQSKVLLQCQRNMSKIGPSIP